MYGLPHCQQAGEPLTLHLGDLSRHSNGHGGCSYAVFDILDELFARLHPSTGLVVRHFLRDNSLQKAVELFLGLDRVRNL